jgi:hypothetical protein
LAVCPERSVVVRNCFISDRKNESTV